MSESPVARIGFIGVGVMGEPMCRHLAQKSSIPVTAFDLDPEPLLRLMAHGVGKAEEIIDAAAADVVFISLPSGEVVNEVARAPDGLLVAARQGQIFVDLSTSSVATTRRLAQEFAERGAAFADAPVARTRAAAETGQLSVMVGAHPETFARIEPLLATFATDVTLCGDVGAGQVVKILNNWLLFHNVVALCEAGAIARRMGVDSGLLFPALAKGSADSFALRNHIKNAVLPDVYPLRSFSVRYARKDLAYGLAMAAESGLDTATGERIEALFDAAIAAGFADEYWPVVNRLIDRGAGNAPRPSSWPAHRVDA